MASSTCPNDVKYEPCEPVPCEYVAKGCPAGAEASMKPNCIAGNAETCYFHRMYKMLRNEADIPEFHKVLQEYVKRCSHSEVVFAMAPFLHE